MKKLILLAALLLPQFSLAQNADGASAANVPDTQVEQRRDRLFYEPALNEPIRAPLKSFIRTAS